MLNFGLFFSNRRLRNWVAPVALISALLIVWRIYENWPSKELHLSGTVLDVETRKPVGKAKIIVGQRHFDLIVSRKCLDIKGF